MSKLFILLNLDKYIVYISHLSAQHLQTFLDMLLVLSILILYHQGHFKLDAYVISINPLLVYLIKIKRALIQL